MRRLLSDIEIQRGLSSLRGWARQGNTLVKTVTARTFPAGIALVDKVASEAEALNHHPDIDIRYTKITFTLSTHDSGGVTEKDLELAGAIDRAEG